MIISCSGVVSAGTSFRVLASRRRAASNSWGGFACVWQAAPHAGGAVDPDEPAVSGALDEGRGAAAADGNVGYRRAARPRAARRHRRGLPGPASPRTLVA